VHFVRTYTTSVHDSSGVLIKDSMLTKEVDMYNGKGYLLKESDYASGYKPVFVYVRIYGKKHYLKRFVKAKFRKWFHYRDFSIDTTIYTIDDYKYTFDGKGNEIEVQLIEDGKPSYRSINTFDSMGNRIESANYTPGDTLYSKETCKYDSAGMIIEKTGFWKIKGNTDSIPYGCAYSYDANENLSEIDDLNSDGSIQNITTMKYFNFDAKGNWLKEIHYRNDKPDYIIERNIQYY